MSKGYEPPEGWVVQAYRFAYNRMLARVSAVRAQREAEASYGVPEDGLTPWQGWSLAALRLTWNRIKPDVAPWWTEVSKEAFNTGLDGLSRALNNWHASRTGQRRGRPVGYPTFRTRYRGERSCRFTTGAIRVESDRRHVVLPRLGRIRTTESTRKPPHRPLRPRVAQAT